MATARLLGRGTAGSGAVEEIVIGSGLTLTGTTLSAAGGGITIGTTAITSGTIGRLLFQGTGNVVQQSGNLFWDNTNSQLALGTSSPIASTRLTIFSSGTTSSTFGLQVHNNTGTNNALVVRDDSFVGILTDVPIISGIPLATTVDYLSIRAGTTNEGFKVTDRGIAFRKDVNGTVWQDFANQSNLGNSSLIIRLSNSITQASAWIGKAGNSYTAHQLGNEPQSLVLFNKANTNNRMKFALLSTDVVGNSYFDFLVGSTSGGALSSDNNINGGVSQTSSIMRLFGNTSLSLGTTTNVASSILTLESTSKGFLPPRMTTAERDLIATPATGLTLYNTSTNTLDIRSSASVWNKFGSETVIIGTGTTSATFGLQVHNSTGNNNALVVRDDGRVLVNSSSLAFTGTNNTRLQVGTNDGVTHSADVISSATAGGQATFLRLRNDGATKFIQFDNAAGVSACAIQHSNSSSNIVQLKNASNNVEQIFEVNDFNLSGRALLAAGNSSARLVLVRSGTISIGLYDNNSNDSFWNPFGTRTFIFGATTRTNASALVEMTSTTRGFLPPRMTSTDRLAISSPANGLCVIQTDGGAGVEGLWRYQSSTTAWVRIG